MPSPRSRTASATRPWKQAAPAPVVVITGAEGLFVERAVSRILKLATAEHDQIEATQVEAASYETGTLARLASPSLFEEHRVITVVGLAEANDAAATDILEYLRNPQPDVVLVVCHGGGNKAKKVIEAAKAAPGALWIDCPVLKKDVELLALVADEFAAAGRTISTKGAQLLVDAFGSDVRELASSCAQLIADVTTDVDVEDVRRYYGGRAEASGFEVADALVARDAGRALLTLRQAVDSGVDPIPMVAAIAMKLRQLAKVSVASGPSGQVAKELGMPPWMIDSAKRQLRAWNPEALAAAIVEVAAADVALKGGVEVGGRVSGGTADAVFTMERLVLRACSDPH